MKANEQSGAEAIDLQGLAVLDWLPEIEAQLQPVTETHGALQAKRSKLLEKENAVRAAEQELADLEDQLEDELVRASMSSGAPAKQKLQALRERVADCQERLSMARAGVRGFQRAIADDETRLAELGKLARAAHHKLVATLSERYEVLLRAESERFAAVVGLGLSLAAACRMDVLELQLRKIRVGLPDGTVLVGDHASYEQACRDAAADLFQPLKDQLSNLMAVLDDAQQVTRDAEDRAQSASVPEASGGKVTQFWLEDPRDFVQRREREKADRQVSYKRPLGPIVSPGTGGEAA
jgi:hypothetical protein